MNVYGYTLTDEQIGAAKFVMTLRHSDTNGFRATDVMQTLEIAGVPPVNDSWQLVSLRAAERLIQDALEARQIKWNQEFKVWQVVK